MCVLFIVCVCITLYFVYIEVLQNHTADVLLVFMFVNCQFSVLHFFKHMKVTAYYFIMVLKIRNLLKLYHTLLEL